MYKDEFDTKEVLHEKMAEFLTGPEVTRYCKLFSRLRMAHLKDIIETIKHCQPFHEGDKIESPNDPLDYIYLVADGIVERRAMGISARPL